ncbi:hypothetical protein CcaverHIS631_0607940 [Cutaneotrichosporon cavernicola]|nr:hypothetical protein CcaverHIS631_0607940 [Cutaneotrichosporon cavernicola]
MLARARLCLASRVQRPAVSTVRLSSRFNSTASSSSPGSSSSSSWSFNPHRAILGGLTLGAILYATLAQETQLDAPKERLITYAEVQKHNSQDDCWVVIGDKVYDLTKFAHIHPGGSTPIHKVAGRDATVIFTPIHSPGIIEDRLDPSALISTNASASLEATVNAAGAPQIMQLYVNKQRSNSEALLHKVTSLGLKGVVVTVDCASPGKREADERNRATVEASSGLAGGVAGRDKKGGGVGRTTGAYIDPRLKWEDLAWIRQHTFLPIGVKGIQCVEDAEGVVHAIDIMRDEIEVTMKLLGVTRLDQLGPHLLNTKVLDQMVIDKLDYGPKEGYVG